MRVEPLVQARNSILEYIRDFFEQSMLSLTYVLPYTVADKVLSSISINAPYIYTVISASLDMIWKIMVLKFIITDLLTLTNSVTSITPLLSGPDIFLASILVITLYLFTISEITLSRELT
jgi:hypothetical protein